MFMGGQLPGESFVLLSEILEERNTNPLNPVTLAHKRRTQKHTQTVSHPARWYVILFHVSLCDIKQLCSGIIKLLPGYQNDIEAGWEFSSNRRVLVNIGCGWVHLFTQSDTHLGQEKAAPH